MEAMKDDMLTLLKQLQESEERCNHLSNVSSNIRKTEVVLSNEVNLPTIPSQYLTKIKDLEKLNKAKADKIRGYREIIVRLKDEFIKSETEKAAADVEAKSKLMHNSEVGIGQISISQDELRELRRKISDLHEGLKQAKDDFEKARKARERLTNEKQAALDEVHKIEEINKKNETQAQTIQVAYHRVRKELEESKRKEVKLKDKLKEFLGGDGTGSGTASELRKAKDRISILEKELDLLQTQNFAMKRGNFRQEENKDLSDKPKLASSSGQILGVGNMPDEEIEGDITEIRSQMRSKWEVEKKQQRR
jgi:uncharacterized phage infection (PIP) family protein YhgE